MRLCPKTGRTCLSSACDIECFMEPLMLHKLSLPPSVAHIPLDKLRSIYAGLGRAIESGDPLQIGLILGQVYKELEQYVNTTTTGDNSFTVPVNTESHGVQRSTDTRPDITFGNKE